MATSWYKIVVPDQQMTRGIMHLLADIQIVPPRNRYSVQFLQRLKFLEGRTDLLLPLI